MSQPTNQEEVSIPIEASFAYYDQVFESLSLRMDIMELELQMWKSRASRSKNAWDYVEEAVAAEFGIETYQFRQKPEGKGRPKGDQLPAVRKAQFLLFSMLKSLIGINVNQIRENYGPFVTTYMAYWGELFVLVHRPQDKLPRKGGSVTKEDYEAWSLYAPKYRGVYARLREAMLADGVWLDEYEDEYLPK